MTGTFFCVRPGIDMERWFALRQLDPDFLAWSNATSPSLATATELVALDESLSTWEAEHIGIRKWNHPKHLNVEELRTWKTIVRTPPARPEWLTTINRCAA